MSTNAAKIYFTDFFAVTPEVLEGYGAFNISLINDLPLFIDPFLLFDGEKPEYQSLHEQIILAEYSAKKKITRREKLLLEMEQIVPWAILLREIEPLYPVAGRGRRPYPCASMLRIHLMQHWFALSDPGMEDALYEIESMRHFAGIKLNAVPDETTILNFRRFIEDNDLSIDILDKIQPASGTQRLAAQDRHRGGCHHHQGAMLDQE